MSSSFLSALALSFLSGCRRSASQGEPRETARGGAELPKDTFEIKSGYVSGKSEPEIGKRGGTLNIETQKNPGSFNPYAAKLDVSDVKLFDKLYRSPMRYNISTWKIEPEIAEFLTSSPDGNIHHLRLRPDLKWSDGTPVTIQDILFNLDLALTSHPKDNFKDSSGELPTYKAIDERTIRFQYKNSAPALPWALTKLPLLPRHLWHGAFKSGKIQQVLTVAEYPKKVVGLGPFKLTKYVADEIVILDRNEYFWKKDRQGTELPYLDQWVIKVIPDSNTVLLNFKGAKIDLYENVGEGDVVYLNRIASERNSRVYDGGPSNTNMYFTFNQHPGKNPDGKSYVQPYLRGIFENQKFREAVSWAIDRKGIRDLALSGGGFEQYCVVAKAANPHWAIDCEPTPHNPAKASALLDEAGLKDRDGDGIRDTENGEPVSFQAMVRSDDKIRQSALEVVRTDLEKIGIKVTSFATDQNTFMAALTANHDWESMLSGSYAADPYPGTNNLLWRSSGRLHFWYPNQPSPATPWEAAIDKNYDCIASTMDEEKQHQCYAKVQKILREQFPIIPLVGLNALIAADSKLGNLAVSPYLIRGQYNAEEIFWR